MLALAALLPRLALAAALLTTLMAAALLAALTWLLIGLGRLSAALLAALVWIVCLVHFVCSLASRITATSRSTRCSAGFLGPIYVK